MAFSSTSFNELQVDPAEAGRAGGQSRSRAKVAAVKRNGKLGGRPPTRTLAERLLGRTLRTADERARFKEALDELFIRERQILLEFFGVNDFKARVPVILKPTRLKNQWRPTLTGHARERALRPTVSILHSKEWRQQTRRQPRHIRYIIRKLKLAASQYFPPARS